ncbi:hotdog domain-containing protein [Streptomyces sp. NPDC055808]|uniref:hotdog domain-containing protein n=1 Tax=Streptomyces sp. NPDC001828 TaxID=3364615 RepID=UPI003673F8C2
MMLQEVLSIAELDLRDPSGPAAPPAADETVRGSVTVAHGAPFLRGHCPGFPLVPGFALVQYVYDLVSAHGVGAGQPMVVKKARFLSPVRPGEELVIEARIERSGGGVRATASVSADARPAARIALHFPPHRPDQEDE